MRHLSLLLLLTACAAETAPKHNPADPDPRSEDPSLWPEDLFGIDSERPAGVYAPSDYSWDEHGMLPVIVLLHGYSVNSGIQELMFQIKARRNEGYIAILPEGTENELGLRFWNATEACCGAGSDVDDVGYLLSLIDEAEEHFPVDPDRILLTGHSNGGYMSHRLACDAADRIAGIASLAGSTFDRKAQCKASEPVAMLQMHGDEDATIYYDGSSAYPGAVETTKRWSKTNGCSGSVEDPDRDYVDSLDGDDTTVIRYEDCEASTELWTHLGSGHTPAFNDTWRDDMLNWLLAQRR